MKAIKLPYRAKGWNTRPISATCEVIVNFDHDQCGKPTDFAYPASGGGWMALCSRHGLKHYPVGAWTIEEVIASGETFA